MSALSGTGSKLEQYAIPIIAIILIGVAIYFFAQGTSASSGTQVIAGSDDSASVNAAQASDKAQELAGFTALVQYATTENTNATQLAETESDNATTIGTSQIQSLTTEALGADQLAAERAQANAALDAVQAQAHAQQQNGFWTSIASIFASIGGAFTGSHPSATTAVTPVGTSANNGTSPYLVA